MRTRTQYAGVDFRRAKGCSVGRDNQVANRHQSKPRAKRRTVNGRNNWHSAFVYGTKCFPSRQSWVDPSFDGFNRLRSLIERLEVHPRAERSRTRTCKDNCTGGLIITESSEDVSYFRVGGEPEDSHPRAVISQRNNVP